MTTITNVRLGRLGLTAADIAMGLCPEAVAHLERCALAARVSKLDTGGAGQAHGQRFAVGDGAERAPEQSGAFLYAPTRGR